MSTSNKVWFEVFEENCDEGTETVETFDTLEEADQYLSDNCTRDLYIDKWEFIDGENVKVDM